MATASYNNDIPRLINFINNCLDKLEDKNLGFDASNTPIFVFTTAEDERTYAKMMDAFRSLRETYKDTRFQFAWVQKTIFDKNGRDTGLTRFRFQMK